MIKLLCLAGVCTYAVDLFDDVFEDEGGGETVVLAEGISSDVFKDHLYCRIVQFEGLDLYSG